MYPAAASPIDPTMRSQDSARVSARIVSVIRSLENGSGREASGARAGTVAAVMPLREATARYPSYGPLRRATRQAIAEIQARLAGAEPGQLSLAGGEAGQLSLAEGESGQLSLAEGEGGRLSLGEEGGRRLG